MSPQVNYNGYNMKVILTLILMFIALPATADTQETSLDCMAKNIYFEARGDGALAMLLVGQVTLNRIESNRFPNTVCGVVTQHKQFSWFSDGLSDTAPVNTSPAEKEKWKKATMLARTLLTKGNVLNDLTNGSLHYHNHDVNPTWNKNMDVALVHVGHIFYN